MTKRIALLFAIATLAVLLVPALAFANFGPHGNYVTDTDSCAGCHRAHTSVSSITWQDQGGNDHSALLVSSATTMYEFCYACHDATSQGADTNVQQGLYEGTLYGSNGAILNGGGFESFGTTTPVTSTHLYNGASWGAYGGGYAGQGTTGANGQIPGENQGESVQIQMDCATCHDPHGSSNYRILKAYVNGNYVGGYQDSGDPQFPTPDGFVSSNETGWPATGFQLHTEYLGYKPNYTTALYAKGYDMPTGAPNVNKGMSGWCAGCHSTYLLPVTEFTKPSSTTTYLASASVYNAGDGGGLALRHKHPINVELSTYHGPDETSFDNSPVLASGVLPLAHDLGANGTVVNGQGDWIECLTCHRAHGTAAVMKGYALDGSLAVDTDGVARNNFVSATPSALLRLDNRGVCEVCHNK
jgi:hypothetical protein